MILLVDDKQVEALEARRAAEEQLSQEPPPTYASLQPSSSAASVVKTVNHVSITRTHSSVRETLIVDPSLFVPLFLRPQLSSGETEETRKNLKLESTHGHVNADITLVENTNTEIPVSKNSRVKMQMRSTHGGIIAKIHGQSNRASFVLHAQSINGEMRLHIPRNFQGPIIVTYRHGSLRFSDAISRNLTLFGEVDNTRRCFLGDFSQWSDAGEGWTGDELIADVKHGNVKIHYDDDTVGSPVKTRPTLLNRIFGF